MDARESSGAPRKTPSWLFPLLGYAISIACLVWVYRGFDWRGELARLKATDWRWIWVSVVFDVLVYFVMGWRWNVLLSPLARLPVMRTIQAVYIGLFANEALPLRSGEVIRCYLLSRWSGLPFPMVLSSVVIERVLDGVWLLLGFFVAAQFVKLPGAMVQGGNVLLLIVLGLGGVIAWAVIHRSRAQAAVSRSRWAKALRHVVDGLHAMGRSRSFFGAVVLSFLYLALQVFPIWCLMRGYGLELSIWSAATVLMVVRLASVPPQAPANLGSVQLATVLTLGLFGVDRAEATGFATLLFVIVTGPLWLGGFIALMATRMRLSQLHREAHGEEGAGRAPTTADI